jgi:hypothetical protein
MILGRWRSGHWRFQETWCLCWRWRFLGRLDSWNQSKKYSKIFWTLKMDAFCSFETLGTSYPVTRVRRCKTPNSCVTPACLWQGSRAYLADVTKRFFTIRISHVRYKHKCKLIYAHKKCTVLRSSLSSVDMYIGVSYAEFHGNREINVGSTDRHSRDFSHCLWNPKVHCRS